MTEYAARTFAWRPVDHTTLLNPEVLPSGMADPLEQLTISEARRHALYEIRTGVLSYDMPGHIAKRSHTVAWQVPASSWQMFKREHEHAWWLRWLVRRRAVELVSHERTVHLQAEWKDYAVYPWQQVAPTTPQLGTPVRHVQLVVQVREAAERVSTPETPEAPAEG